LVKSASQPSPTLRASSTPSVISSGIETAAAATTGLFTLEVTGESLLATAAAMVKGSVGV
jgi:hypothetical protein